MVRTAYSAPAQPRRAPPTAGGTLPPQPSGEAGPARGSRPRGACRVGRGARRRDGRACDREHRGAKRDQGEGQGARERHVRGVPRRAGGASRRSKWPSGSIATTRCCGSCWTSTASVPGARSASVRARLRGPRAGGARPAAPRRGAARGVLVALRARVGGRVPGHEPAPERAARACSSRGNLFRVGDENQSIYRFRNADVSVFREHWQEAPGGRTRREHHRELPIARRGARRDRPRVRARMGHELRAAQGGARVPRAGGARAALRGPARGGQGAGRLEGNDGAGGIRSGRRSTARLRGARPRRACWRSGSTSSSAGGRGRTEMWCCCSARPGRWAWSGGRPRARDARARGRGARLLGASSRWPTCALAGGGEPARRAGALLGARLAARGPVARRRRPDRRCTRGARTGIRGGWCASRPRSLSARCPSRDRRQLRAFVERFEAERRIVGQVSLETLVDRWPRARATTVTCWRCPAARAGWRTCAS